MAIVDKENFSTKQRRIAQNTIFLYIRMIVVTIITLYTSREILRVLGIEDFGIYNAVGSIVLMFSFLNGSLSSATSRFLTVALGQEDKSHTQKVFNLTLLCHIGIALVIVIIAETIGLWYLENKLVIPSGNGPAIFWVYQLSVLAAVISIIQVPYTAVIIARENMKVYAYSGLVEAALRLGVVYILLISPINMLVAYAVLQFAVQVILMMYYLRFCMTNYPESHVKFYWDKKLFKEIAGYSTSSLLNTISVELQSQGINLLLNFFFGPVVNAARAIASQVQGAVTRLSSNFTTAARPQIIKLYVQGDIENMMALTKVTACLSFYLMCMFITPICLESTEILKLWLNTYPEETDAFMIIILIQNMILTVGNPRCTIFAATGKIHKINIITSIILAISFPLAYILMKCYESPIYAFYSTLFCIIINEITGWIVLKQYVNYSTRDVVEGIYLRCIVVGGISALVPILLHLSLEPSGGRVLIVSVSNALTLGISVYCFGLSTLQRTKVKSMFKTKLNAYIRA